MTSRRRGRKRTTRRRTPPFHTLLRFVERTLGHNERHRIRLVITGDDHHYAHYVPKPPVSRGTAFGPDLVTCGGGGAFLASTHHLPSDLAFSLNPWQWIIAPTALGPGDYESLRYGLEKRCPGSSTSRRLSLSRLPGAVVRNGWTLPALLGVATLPPLLSIARHDGWSWFGTWPFQIWLAAAVLLLGGYAQSGTKERELRPGRRVFTGVLTAAHIALYVGVAWLTARVIAPLFPVTLQGSPPMGWPALPLWILALAGSVDVLGFLGMVAFLGYLRIADGLRCHTLEAFSGLQIQDYKCHLRLRFTSDRVHVYVIGIDRVPRARSRARLSDVLPSPRVVDRFSVVLPPRPRSTAPGPTERSDARVGGGD